MKRTFFILSLIFILAINIINNTFAPTHNNKSILSEKKIDGNIEKIVISRDIFKILSDGSSWLDLTIFA